MKSLIRIVLCAVLLIIIVSCIYFPYNKSLLITKTAFLWMKEKTPLCKHCRYYKKWICHVIALWVLNDLFESYYSGKILVFWWTRFTKFVCLSNCKKKSNQFVRKPWPTPTTIYRRNTFHFIELFVVLEHLIILIWFLFDLSLTKTSLIFGDECLLQHSQYVEQSTW